MTDATDSKQYIDDAKRFASMFGGFIKAAEILAPVASIQQAQDEATARLDGLRQQEDELKQSIAKQKAETESACAALVKDAEKQAADLRTKANAIILKAQTMADDITQKATQGANSIVGAARDQEKDVLVAIDTHNASLKALTELVASKQNETEAADRELAKRTANLHALKEELKGIRARVATVKSVLGE